MRLKIEDVERLKKAVRKMAAGRVLSGDAADPFLELAQMDGCQVRIAAGYGSNSESAPLARERLIWILDGSVDIQDPSGQTLTVSQGQSTLLPAGVPFRLAFPHLTLYLTVEAKGDH